MRAFASVVALGVGAVLACAATAAEVDCLVQPWRDITVSSAIEGVVEEVMVDRGDRVAQGQVLAHLESSVEEAAVEIARARAGLNGSVASSEARMRFAERELGRQQELQKKDVVSARDMDQHQSAKRVADAELLEARESKWISELELKRSAAVLEQRTIRSPVAGVVVKRILSPGEYADPPQIIEIAQIDPLRVEVFAPLALLGKITLGMQADVLPELPVGGTYEAKVIVVDPVIDAASGTFGVRLEMPNPEWALPAGLKCRVRFSIPDALADPAPPGAGAHAEPAPGG